MLESIITILLTIILIPVVLFIGAILLFMLLAFIFIPIIIFLGWIIDKIF